MKCTAEREAQSTKVLCTERSICHLRWMICNNKVVDDMPLFERMICNFCEIDDIQCLRIDFKKPSPVGEGGPLAVDEVLGE